MSYGSPKICIRSATPSLDEGMAFAEFMNIASDGFFMFLIGRKYREILATAFLEKGHDLSYEHVLIAEQDNKIIGITSGYTSAQHEAATMTAIRKAAGWRMLRVMAVALFNRKLLEFLDHVPEGHFYVQAIAVIDTHRGMGIGSKLLNAIEQKARASQSAHLSLDVATKNTQAYRLYERIGFKKITTSPKPLFSPEHRVYRMSKPL